MRGARNKRAARALMSKVGRMQMADEADVKVPVRADGLQLEEHRDWQRGVWRAERVGWAGFALVISLALAGVTGRGGWLATAETRMATAAVEAPHFARRGEQGMLSVTLFGGAGTHSVQIGGDMLEHWKVEGILPQPMQSVASGEGLAMQFGTFGPAPHRLRFHLRARTAGMARGAVTVDGAAAEIRSLILP